MAKYDYLIVGAGLSGCVIARELAEKGYSVMIIDKRNHVGGNVYTEEKEGVMVHKYGAHIFHTSDEEVWKYVNRFSQFNNFINSPIASYKGKYYNLPFNMNTFNQVWGVKTPKEAMEIISLQSKQISSFGSLADKAKSMVGHDIFEMFIKGYSEKQWGKKCSELPASIIKRIPLRFTYDNNYFNDRYQGIPVNGYTHMVNMILDHDLIDVELQLDYFLIKDLLINMAVNIVYTGPIDKYFNYAYGELEYRSLRFDEIILKSNNFQGNAVINFTDVDVPYTRVIEHRHFDKSCTSDMTVITKEYSIDCGPHDDPYYPINDIANEKKYHSYKSLADKEPNTIFAGRLAEYSYYDMDKVIRSALNKTAFISRKV